MKRLKITFALLFITILLISCNKDDENPTPTTIVYQDENPIPGYITSTGIDQNVSNAINEGDYEFGAEFTPLVNGNIKSITVKIPDTNPNIRVTVWDATTKTVLRTEYINVTSENVAITKNITALSVEKDKKYAITMNSNDWISYRRLDLASIPYPTISGNIRIERYGYMSGITQTYPEFFPLASYAGQVGFNFQRVD